MNSSIYSNASAVMLPELWTINNFSSKHCLYILFNYLKVAEKTASASPIDICYYETDTNTKRICLRNRRATTKRVAAKIRGQYLPSDLTVIEQKKSLMNRDQKIDIVQAA